MTELEILQAVVEREGGYVNHPADKGGPTKYGITAATLGNWRGINGPAPAEDVQHLSVVEAQDIYRVRYVEQPGFTVANVPFEPLRVQLIDFGINSGPERAIRWLQRVLKPVWVGVDINGKLDVNTQTALEHSAFYLTLVNDALVAARLYMIDTWTDADRTQKVFEEGVESRALTFFLAKP